MIQKRNFLYNVTTETLIFIMFHKFKILATTFSSAVLLLFVLCLGSQNLSDRHSIDLGIAKTAQLPTGFIVGLSLITGVVAGGSITAILLPLKNNID